MNGRTGTGGLSKRIALLLLTASAPAAPRWFVPARPSASAIVTSKSDLSGTPGSTEYIFVTGIGHRAATQADPHQEAPYDPMRAYDSGASWGSTHPGEFCCATQYETGMDGQAGR